MAALALGLGVLFAGCKKEAAAPAHPSSGIVQFSGVGLQLRKPPGEPAIIAGVVPHSAAARAGLQRGSRLLAIDGTQTAPQPLLACVNSIRGEPGTSITLQIVTAGGDQTNEVTLVREKITFAR